MLVEQLFIESESDHTPIEILIQSELSKNQRPKQSGVIIAHPYGPLGGNMDNNVVIRLHKHFCAKGYVSVCLNFRGCGRSKGKTSWTGLPERDDYLSVVNYLLDSNKYRSSSFPMITDLILCVRMNCQG
ncbi:hypothetical protein BDF20DRAFT_859253 [Mycotypha africana]|uniref:uncharacterized protein n=1 Tax=Mycotypha africana TaxID=64632 RepID=UPI0023002CF1|nr:uncharacterized protein BDF20DRAFT_859253 [Mycotypha africana]KAI8984322.1 hypothetical protein BDF20DRAFT_859253 [Mycotypha africana]